METLKGTVIPDNIHVEITRNYGETANDKVNELLLKMFIATGAVCALIYLFLGMRPTIVVLVVIPIVILVTVFSAWLLGFTIDRVSLFALIFSIGILVDDATVVVENIYRRWLIKGSIDTDTTIDAVREVGNPTILATFTVIAALLPMGFVSGMMGPYMMPIPVLGSVAMLLSLLAAFMFTPWLAIRIRPSLKELHKLEESEHKFSHRLTAIYDKLLTPLLDSPRKARLFRIAIWVAFLLCCMMFYTTHVTVKMLPLDNKPEFNVVVNMPEGTALPVTANLVQELADETLKMPEVTAVQTYTGTASPFNFNGLVRHYYLRDKPWEGDVQIQLLHKSKRKRSSHQIAVEAREKLTPIAAKYGALIQVVEMPPGPPVLQTMVAEIYGPDDATRRQVAKDVTEIFRKAESIVDVDNYIQAPHDTWSFVVNQQKAEYQNVTTEDVTKQLAMVMGGQKLGAVKVGRELEPRFIVIQAPLEVRSQFAQLGELPIQTRDNRLVPLAELGSFVRQPADPIVFHKDLRPIEYVTGEVAGRLAAPVYGMIEIADLLKDYKTPDGVTLSGHLVGPPADDFKSGFEWTGEWTVTYETFRDMGLAFGAALVLIYMLVVMEFGNFRLPGIIMAPIPLTLIGIIPGHWLFGAEFTATSMIGWIALAGIIVRNSILLVDFSKHAIADGMPVRTAVLEAARTRTRPIVITSLALIAGSASILTDPIFQGMAISLLFGAIVSTALTLIVIPIACNRAAGAFSAARRFDESPEGEIVGAPAAAFAQAGTPACAPASTEKPGMIERMLGGARSVTDAQSATDGTSTGARAGWLAPISTAFAVVIEALRHLLTTPSDVNATGLRRRLQGLWSFVTEALAHLFGKAPRSGGGGSGGSTPPAGGTPTPAPSSPANGGAGGMVPAGGAAAPQAATASAAVVEAAPVSAQAADVAATGSETTTALVPVQASASDIVIPATAVATVAAVPAVATNGSGAATVTVSPAAERELLTAPADGDLDAVPTSNLAQDAASRAVAAALGGTSTVAARAVAATEPTPATIASTVATASRAIAAGVTGGPAVGADDLQRIKGIGTLMAAQLAALGVNRIAQIASWKHSDIVRIEEVLAAKGRVERENWVGQAQAIVLGGTPHAGHAAGNGDATADDPTTRNSR